MDYKKIIITGYLDKNNWKFFTNYIQREWAKAEKENYGIDEFFTGCLSVIEGWESEFEKPIQLRKGQLHKMLGAAINGTIKYKDLEGKTIEEKNKETIQYCNDELSKETKNSMGSIIIDEIEVDSRLRKIEVFDKITYNDVMFIKTAILKEYKNAKEKEINVSKIKHNGQMTIEEKIIYYKEIKWNIPFRALHHTVVTVCDFVKPIYPNIEPLKYIEYFLKEIDFDKIDNEATKEETLKYCNTIYYGLEQILKADISKAILNYQNNIAKLSKEQIQETQIQLIQLIGNLKGQARTNEAGISFTQRYNSLYKSIEAKNKLLSIDYQILIAHFNETIANDLLSIFEIINETFKEITPLLKALPPQQNETKTEKETPKTFKELFYNPEHAEPCLKILSELQPPVIDAINNYIGKAKGVFPLWVKVLKNHKPEPLIKHFKDTVYKDLLNNEVKGLNLTKDASEFRKQYVRLENDKIELDIKTILSQYSQSGKLGK